MRWLNRAPISSGGCRAISRSTIVLAVACLVVPARTSVCEDRADKSTTPSLASLTAPGFDPLGLPLIKSLPDPFLRPDGSRVSSTEEWRVHREYLIEMLKTLQYGHSPLDAPDFRFEKTLERPVFEKRGVEEQYRITMTRNGLECAFRVALVRPHEVKRYPTIIKNCYTFFDDTPYTQRGGHMVRPMEKITQTIQRDRFAAQEALRRGYVLCKFMREDVADDYPGQRDKKIYRLYPEYDWGAIAAWSWTYSTVIDFLDQLGYADTSRLVATGHSRGGKTALWATILEPRIAICAPSASGTGGTSSIRFSEKGQALHGINRHQDRHPHWWTPRWFGFRNNEYRLPYDAHTVRSLVAPRPLLNTYGREDYMTNPYGAQVAHEAAKLVYEWLGVGDRIAMHWRRGGHAQGPEDWQALFDFADWRFSGKMPEADFDKAPFAELKPHRDWEPPRKRESTARHKTALKDGK